MEIGDFHISKAAEVRCSTVWYATYKTYRTIVDNCQNLLYVCFLGIYISIYPHSDRSIYLPIAQSWISVLRFINILLLFPPFYEYLILMSIIKFPISYQRYKWRDLRKEGMIENWLINHNQYTHPQWTKREKSYGNYLSSIYEAGN